MVRVVARRGIDPAWIWELARAGGSETWYVVERPVPATEWLRSFDAISGARPVRSCIRSTRARSVGAVY